MRKSILMFVLMSVFMILICVESYTYNINEYILINLHNEMNFINSYYMRNIDEIDFIEFEQLMYHLSSSISASNNPFYKNRIYSVIEKLDLMLMKLEGIGFNEDNIELVMDSLNKINMKLKVFIKSGKIDHIGNEEYDYIIGEINNMESIFAEWN